MVVDRRVVHSLLIWLYLFPLLVIFCCQASWRATGLQLFCLNPHLYTPRLSLLSPQLHLTCCVFLLRLIFWLLSTSLFILTPTFVWLEVRFLATKLNFNRLILYGTKPAGSSLMRESSFSGAEACASVTPGHALLCRWAFAPGSSGWCARFCPGWILILLVVLHQGKSRPVFLSP